MGADYRKTVKVPIMWNGNTWMIPNATRYFTSDALVGGTNDVIKILPMAGELYDLICEVNVGPGVGETFDFTLILNGAPTLLTCQIAGAAIQAEDLVNIIPVVRGDDVYMRVVSSLNAANAFVRASMIFKVY